MTKVYDQKNRIQLNIECGFSVWHGLDGIQSSPINNHYSKAFKQAVLLQHLEEAETISGLVGHME